MPRTARVSAEGICYHLHNRGNGRAEVFHKDGDYASFLQLMAEANERLPLRILAYALLPNHFHLVLWPRGAGDLSRWMQWLLTSHVRRYHRHYHGSGHVWQGRFKAFPIQQDEHLLTVLRYVERNPLRASLVRKAENWAWSSLAWRAEGQRPAMLSDWPIPCPRNWLDRVNSAQTKGEVEAVRKSIARGAPFGDERWSTRTANRLGLEASLRPRDDLEKRGAGFILRSKLGGNGGNPIHFRALFGKKPTFSRFLTIFRLTFASCQADLGT